MVQKLASEGLTKLCSNEQLQLLNAIDSLRSQGIDRYISLPQIIVCGDQSSGKSSVLEAISGVSFPIKSSLCTRFPTEIVLRKTADPSVNVSIIPHHTRSEADQDSLARFHAKLDSFSGLPGLIDDAKDAMGIAEFGKTFSKDRLRVEISGPDRPHLTIVDLPGLIHSETKYQSAEDVDLIRSMVQDYMDKPRTIILAVVSAKNDYPNQIVLKLARRADPRGLRTIGVITKPDDLAPGSGNEKSFIALASNQDIHFRLGWHVLRNVDSDRNECPLSERDKQEAAFFSTGSWVDLDQSILGIDKLRSRLSEVLTQQIADELPALIEEIDTQISSCQRRLGHLGKPRSTQSEQTLYLIEISQEFQTVVKEACDGAYNHSFFGDAMTSSGAAKRYRAVIQKLNRDFAVDIGRNGRRREVTPTTRDSFLRDIIVRMTRTQGRELPGMFNPTIVTDLFKEQASPWRGRVESSLEEIRGASEAFLRHVITHIADESSYLVILKHIVEPRFEHIMSAVRQETNKLLEHIQSQHLITYNQLFFPKLQSIRAEREKSRYTEIIEQRNGLGYYSKATELSSALLEWTHEDMERSAASGALDYLEAYYEVSFPLFYSLFHALFSFSLSCLSLFPPSFPSFLFRRIYRK